MSDPDSFYVTASVLGLGTCEILCVPLRAALLFLRASGSLMHRFHWPSKPDVLGTQFLSGSFNGLGPGGMESTIRK